MTRRSNITIHLAATLFVALFASFLMVPETRAQDTVTGAFEGTVSNSLSGDEIEGADVQIINQQTGQVINLRTDSRGRFFQGLLAPGLYTIRVSASGYQTRAVEQRLKITFTGEVVPVPVSLDPVTSAPVSAAAGASTTTAALSADDTDIRASINATDGRRSGSFTEEEVSTLPLGATTLTRSFDELTLLLPGVALPPQTTGSVAGPGVGAGVGTAGQFAVNGLRSRANNFTVDGSDNNDEDIGVRRQGFLSLIPQSIESVKEYQAITLLAPAQFGRNLGAQVNAVSKSGGSQTHGTIYGFFNSSQLNARNYFDSARGAATSQLKADNGQPILLNGDPLTVHNRSGGKDSFTLGQSGFVLGGPIERGHLFYFVSAEQQILNAAQEESFAVPTVDQRGAFRSGATGIFRDPFNNAPTIAVPSIESGAALFNLFPFPNNPNGVYGANTFTKELPASGHGKVLSGKIDGNFKFRGREQSLTERYNFTDDARIIPATGGALFSSLRPRVRTQNSSFFFNSEVTAPYSRAPVFNQLRLSYGRTRLNFDEIRDTEFLLPSERFPDTPFLLNAPFIFNVTQPASAGVPNSGPVLLRSPITVGRATISTVEKELGVLGQVNIAGFSPLGVDVFNFPQRRVNNTYQIADGLTWRIGNHALAFGADTRRSELNSDLPRNARPLVTFDGAPRLIFENDAFRLPNDGDTNPVIKPEDIAALGAASNFFLTLNTNQGNESIGLRFYQLDFYGQDQWRIRQNLSLSYGLRYEYNTPVREVNGRIENSFTDPALDLAPGLRQFISGRTKIYDPDRNNFAPRVSVAYSPHPFGPNHITVLRAGYGLFYDQILGAVVSQSRNVFPTFLTLNFGGLRASKEPVALTTTNPSGTFLLTPQGQLASIQVPGTLNQYNPDLPLNSLIPFLNLFFPSALGATLPSQRLETPQASHYTFTLEQQLNLQTVISLAYVGTRGRHLLRFATPNLGPSSTITPGGLRPFQRTTGQGVFQIPEALGRVLSPNRPVSGIGAINRFETTASSRYDSLQLQLRGRFRTSLQYQAAYTFGKAIDDVSDVFDLAGAFVLPQNSLTFAGERGPANFDVRHRFAYQFIYDFNSSSTRSRLTSLLFNNLQIAGVGQIQTGQPFSVNSVFDVNLDGNLTDRLNTTNGLVETNDPRQPLKLTTHNTLSLLAPFGQDGQIGRNTFRAAGLIELDMAVTKRFLFGNSRNLIFRADIFNFINRANFGIPVRILEAPGFGQATNTITPGRRVQFALKYSF